VSHYADWEYSVVVVPHETGTLNGKSSMSLRCHKPLLVLHRVANRGPAIIMDVQSGGNNRNLLQERRFLLACHSNGWRMYVLSVGLS
jgi:hypothetical protein